jgi:hypothetical protein
MFLVPCVLFLLLGCRGDGSPRTRFDGEVARGYVKRQVDFGPRIPGSEGHRKTGDWIVSQMRTRADSVIEQRWTHVTVKGDTLPLRNIFARIKPQATERVLFIAHWDTRPTSDEARDPAKRQLPVPGANDGASGVAVLMAIADALKQTPPDVGVDLLFVDGEDYGNFDTMKDVLIGSTYFAEHLPSPDYRPIFGVLFDMVGDADLQIYQEINSANQAPEVVRRVWQQAKDLGYERVFIPETKYQITDDHIPLLKKGLRVIDVIDLDYPREGVPTYHHTPEDTLDKVSAKSLQIVGDVAVSLVGGK